MANIEGRTSWVSGAWNASDIASAQTHLAPFIDELRGQASSTAPGRTASLIELQVAQLLGLERAESALSEKLKNWYSSPEFTDGEKAILENKVTVITNFIKFKTAKSPENIPEFQKDIIDIINTSNKDNKYYIFIFEKNKHYICLF